jgi:hypothetical protein
VLNNGQQMAQPAVAQHPAQAAQMQAARASWSSRRASPAR